MRWGIVPVIFAAVVATLIAIFVWALIDGCFQTALFNYQFDKTAAKIKARK